MIYFQETNRITLSSISNLYSEFKIKTRFGYVTLKDHKEEKERFSKCVEDFCRGDLIAAPFIRLRGEYCPFLKKTKRKGIITVHLSECIPDSFGPIGYRFGFRMRNGFTFLEVMKQVISLPYMLWYTYTHRPDICFYEMEPYIHNKFVKKSLCPYIPHIDKNTIDLIYHLTNGEKRTLLIGGFGYNIKKMAKFHKLQKYIATSKNKEIIIDGKVIPLERHICAEEILLSGITNQVISYNSTVVCWAMQMKDINIICYDSKFQAQKAGHFFSYYSRKTLSNCGIYVRSQEDCMVVCEAEEIKDLTKIM